MADPDVITQLRTQLLACASFVAAGGVAGSIKYPNAAPATTIQAVLAVDSHTGSRMPDGIGPLRGGSFVIYIIDDIATADMEELCKDIGQELVAQVSGLPFTGYEVGLAAEAPSEALAVDHENSRSPPVCGIISLTWGLSG